MATTSGTSSSHDLISADRVKGTPVFGADGKKIGVIKTVMIGKRDGQVRAALVLTHDFLGLGGDYCQVPWEKLRYDADLHGYHLDVTEDELHGSPRISEDQLEEALARDKSEDLVDHHGVPFYYL